jgi:hypothetical protein
MKKQIQLKHLAYNGDFASFEKWIIKLSYVQNIGEVVNIEVFENSDEVIEKDLQIYGDTDNSICIYFNNIYQSKTIALSDTNIEIKFIKKTTIDYQYSKNTEKVNQYIFEVSKIKTEGINL